jgi:hypothetical protein
MPPRRPPLAVHVAGRWLQLLAAIVAMIGLGAGQAALGARAGPLALTLVVLSCFGLAIGLFLVGRSVIAGRRWAWRTAVTVTGALLVFLLYAVVVAPQPAPQRWIASVVTAGLFGVPVALLGLPSARAFFARATAPDE